VCYRAIDSGVSIKVIVNVTVLAFVAFWMIVVSRVMTDSDRIVNAELWDELEQLPSRSGKKRRGDVTLRDGRVFTNVGFYEYRLMSVAPAAVPVALQCRCHADRPVARVFIALANMGLGNGHFLAASVPNVVPACSNPTMPSVVAVEPFARS
jgi:hypothetical protein